MKLLRGYAADGLKEAMTLLMSNDGVLAAMAPLQRTLICDMTGDCAGPVGPDSPVQRSPGSSRATPPKVADLEPPCTILHVHLWRMRHHLVGLGLGTTTLVSAAPFR